LPMGLSSAFPVMHGIVQFRVRTKGAEPASSPSSFGPFHNTNLRHSQPNPGSKASPVPPPQKFFPMSPSPLPLVTWTLLPFKKGSFSIDPPRLFRLMMYHTPGGRPSSLNGMGVFCSPPDLIIQELATAGSRDPLLFRTLPPRIHYALYVPPSVVVCFY